MARKKRVAAGALTPAVVPIALSLTTEDELLCGTFVNVYWVARHEMAVSNVDRASLDRQL